MEINARRRLPLAGNRIRLDASHPGKDPRAVDLTGLKEAEVALAVARQIKTRLAALGAEVRWSRSADQTDRPITNGIQSFVQGKELHRLSGW